MKSNYINGELAEEIDGKIKSVRELDKSMYKLSLKRCDKKAIEKNARIHSYRIENPEHGVPFSVPRNTHRKGIKEGIKNIENAFKWGVENFDPEKFEESFIRELAGRITPEFYDSEIAIYRDISGRIVGSRTIPPQTYKFKTREIPGLVNYIKDNLSCPEIIKKIETAIYSHLHLARIHPFVDGNGRTSRILQDTILDHLDIPVPIIDAGERHTYYNILEKAVSGWNNQRAIDKKEVTEGEELFYDFMAGKINMSLDQILH